MRHQFKRLKTKRLIIPFLFTIYWLPISGQTIDYNQIVVPEGQRATNFEDYLVQLAWLNSPKRQILDLEKGKAEKEVSLKRSKWMDDIGFQFNMNEVSLENVLDTNKADNLVLYPLYQFTAAVDLGTFYNTKKERELKEFDVKISEMEANDYKMAIRAETLARYHNLLLAIETLKVRVKAEENSQNIYDLANQRFKNADLELEDLLRASESYNGAVEKRLDAETEIQLTKLALEEMIGIKWESAKKYEERMKK